MSSSPNESRLSGAPVRLFVCDIDGCLSEPYQPYDLERMAALRAYAALAETEAAYPRLSLCSGRAYPYVEAMTQVLGVREEVLFEAGGGAFAPVAAQVTWHPAFGDDAARRLDEAKAWLVAHILPGTSLMYDYGKRTQAGVIGPVAAEIYAAVPAVEAYAQATHPGFSVFHTPVSIDLVPPGITKAEGLPWLAERAGVSLEEVAFIGDSNGDLGGLGVVGRSFAPSNAAESVREAAGFVAEEPLVAGVLECYERCAEHNRALGM